MLAALASQVVFVAHHLPNRLAFGLRLDGLGALEDLLMLWGMGLAFAIIWLRTRNLFIAVGFHALVNAPTLLLAGPGWIHGASLALGFAWLALLPPRRPRAGLPS